MRMLSVLSPLTLRTYSSARITRATRALVVPPACSTLRLTSFAFGAIPASSAQSSTDRGWRSGSLGDSTL